MRSADFYFHFIAYLFGFSILYLLVLLPHLLLPFIRFFFVYFSVSLCKYLAVNNSLFKAQVISYISYVLRSPYDLIHSFIFRHHFSFISSYYFLTYITFFFLFECLLSAYIIYYSPARLSSCGRIRLVLNKIHFFNFLCCFHGFFDIFTKFWIS